MGRSFSKYVTTLPSLVAIDTAVVVLVCHATLQENVIKGSCDFMERSSLRYVTILPCLVAITTLEEMIMFLVCHVILQDHIGFCNFMGQSPAW